jgi:Na+/glutamate symporter
LKKAKRENKKWPKEIERFNFKKFLDNNSTLSMIIVSVFFIFFGGLFKGKIIGEDIRHTILIFYLPTISGIIFFGWFFKTELLNFFDENSNRIEKSILSIFLTISLGLLSICTFYTGVDCLWIIESSKKKSYRKI